MRTYAELKRALAKSPFRSRFRLTERECRIAAESGREKLSGIAEAILFSHLAPAKIANDGRQTPMRGHPVFVAQHACGMCCRGCLFKWHGIPKGRALTPDEVAKLVQILLSWIDEHSGDLSRFAVTPELFLPETDAGTFSAKKRNGT